MTILASDTFHRADQSGWGTSSGGQVWSSARGSGTYNITSNEGVNSANGATFSVARLGAGTATGTEVLVRLKPADTTSDIGTVARYVDTNNFYYGVLVGGVARIGKDVTGTFTTLASTSVSYNTSNFYWLRFNLQGSDLRLRFWQDGSAEPTTWTVTTTDASLSSGGYGLGSDATGSTSFDSLTVTDGVIPHDLATRFRLASASQLKDLASRFRLQSANQLKDIATRFRLQSAAQLKDVATRFRLQSANQLKDIATRFRLQSAPQLKDAAARFRLQSASQLRDIAARFRLQATSLKDLSTRFRLQSSSQLKDISTRFRLQSANQLKDIATRFRLASASQLRDIAFRLRLQSANQLRDLATRFRLSVGNLTLKDIACRFRLAGSLPVPTLVVVATFRSGAVEATYRDGQQEATHRDGTVTAGGR